MQLFNPCPDPARAGNNLPSVPGLDWEGRTTIAHYPHRHYYRGWITPALFLVQTHLPLFPLTYGLLLQLPRVRTPATAWPLPPLRPQHPAQRFPAYRCGWLCPYELRAAFPPVPCWLV